jgi:hypothetical protein
LKRFPENPAQAVRLSTWHCQDLLPSRPLKVDGGIVNILENRDLPNRSQGGLQAVDWRGLDVSCAELKHSFHLLREKLLCSLDDLLPLLTHVFDVLLPFLNGGLELVREDVNLGFELKTSQNRFNSSLKHRMASSDLDLLILDEVELFYLLGQLFYSLLDVLYCVFDHALESNQRVHSLNDLGPVSR